MKYILNCFGVIVFLAACSSEQKQSEPLIQAAKPIRWISGNYTLKSQYGNYCESWQKIDSVTYYGSGYFMDSTNIDTLFEQRMKLFQTADVVHLFFNVKNQNDNKDVEFRLTKQENKTFTFENAFRDYPSIVTYKILSDTTVNVVMRGFKEGKEKKEDFIITKH
jgi:hypothetical protein